MILADVNVLIYAFDSDAVQHREYATWLAEVLAGSEEFALLDTVLAGFVRIMTHSKIMPKPAPTGLALESVNAIIGAPAARWLPASETLWGAFAKLVEGDGGIRGISFPMPSLLRPRSPMVPGLPPQIEVSPGF